jgi:hypothetical protein
LPHIVFDKKIDLVDFSKKFKPIFLKKEFLIKISRIFVDSDCLSALLPTVIISKLHQEFFIEISTSKSKTTIRLLPISDPKKTNEVKESMVLVARQILDNYNTFKITKTNIPQVKQLMILQ